MSEIDELLTRIKKLMKDNGIEEPTNSNMLVDKYGIKKHPGRNTMMYEGWPKVFSCPFCGNAGIHSAPTVLAAPGCYRTDFRCNECEHLLLQEIREDSAQYKNQNALKAKAKDE